MVKKNISDTFYYSPGAHNLYWGQFDSAIITDAGWTAAAVPAGSARNITRDTKYMKFVMLIFYLLSIIYHYNYVYGILYMVYIKPSYFLIFYNFLTLAIIYAKPGNQIFYSVRSHDSIIK